MLVIISLKTISAVRIEHENIEYIEVMKYLVYDSHYLASSIFSQNSKSKIPIVGN